MNEQKKLYKMIQNYSFILNETVLYLDTHPNCRQALRYYKTYRDRLLEAIRAYEDNYGQLTVYGGKSCDCWQWVNEPWPWEI